MLFDQHQTLSTGIQRQEAQGAISGAEIDRLNVIHKAISQPYQELRNQQKHLQKDLQNVTTIKEDLSKSVGTESELLTTITSYLGEYNDYDGSI